MTDFSELFSALQRPGSQELKQNLIGQFFFESDPDEKMRGLFLLSGRKIKRPVSASKLREIISDSVGIERWLFDECEKSTGNLAETITLMIDDPEDPTRVSLKLVFDFCETCRSVPEPELPMFVVGFLKKSDRTQRLLSSQILCGSFKSGFSSGTIFRLFSEVTGVDLSSFLHLVSTKWTPDSLTFSELVSRSKTALSFSFPVEIPGFIRTREFPPVTGLTSGFHAEWKLTGTELQLVKSSGKVILFDMNGSLVSSGFHDLQKSGLTLPDKTILTGTAVNRAVLFPKTFQQDYLSPAERVKPGFVFICTDLLVLAGKPLFHETAGKRRILLEICLRSLNSEQFLVSEPIKLNWEEFQLNGVPGNSDGILLKAKDQVSLSGWLLLPSPKTITAILVYAQSTQNAPGRVYDELTMAVWKDAVLISVGKVKNTLSDEQNKEISRYIKDHTIERFGPVRTVKPELLFELAFDSVVFSRRHKAGVMLKEPVLLRWIKGAGLQEAEHLSTLEEMAKKSLRTRDTEA